MRLLTFLRFTVILLGTVALTGCIPDQAYQRVGNRSPQYTAPVTGALPSFRENVATIELDGSGSLHSCCGHDQLVFARKLIESARDGVTDKGKVVVLVFIHGNQNNARLDSNNYPHFLQLMDCLNSGELEFKRHMSSLSPGDVKSRFDKFKGSDQFDCKQPPPSGETRYVGVYIGWRGSLNTWRLDFQQRAARRVADHDDILSILRTLRDAAKPNAGDASRLVLIGHSFGGLILERAIYHMYQPQPAGSDAVRSFADVALTFNEATGGLIPKRLIEKTNGYSIVSLTPGSKGKPARPLLITVHSKSDPLTGSFATGGRFIAGPPPVPRATPPENDKAFADPGYIQAGDKPSLGKVRRSNPSNLLYFDNGCYIGQDEIEAARTNAAFITGDRPGCDDVAKALVADPAQADRLRLFPVKAAFPQLARLYRRIEYNCRGSKEPTYKGENRPACSTPQSSLATDYDHLPWNRSADWMINVPPGVVAGHGGYWQPDSVELILELANVWPVLERRESLP
ncbi:MAG: hypothetical protein PW792_04740 [Acidobacteriaceae bacterium]|nr:hypothetical protein [Acidobacteriaceae bacterium]